MSEIYVNDSDRRVYLEVPVTPNGGMTVTVLKDGLQVWEALIVTAETETRYSVQIPYFLSQSENSLVVQWRFEYTENLTTYQFSRDTHVDVVQAILPPDIIQSILGAQASDAEVLEIERATRFIIQAHTGQSFGHYIGTKSVSGSGDKTLRMPKRLLKLVDINGSTYFNDALSIRGDGWYVTYNFFGIPPLKADFHGLHYLNDGVIEAPPRVPKLSWIENAEYVFNGEWGWYGVPESVIEAAKLLVNDYACADTNYRDRYLSSISAADWKIAFNGGAWAATGNARADQLLSNYVLKRGWAVI